MSSLNIVTRLISSSHLGSSTFLQRNNKLVLCQAIKEASSTLSTSNSPILNATACRFASTTKKRRKRYPFFWLADKYRACYDENLSKQNEECVQEFLKQKYSIQDGASPLKIQPWSYDQEWRWGVRRAGVIAKKLGHCLLWTKDGRRLTTTAVQVLDNHVIKYYSPEEYQNICRPLYKNLYQGYGCVVVGSESVDPRLFTAEYNGLFNESGVLTKKKLSKFRVSHEARLEPGTPLFATHFRPGMFVNVFGKTREQGALGVRDRYHLKLGQKTHGTTKSHNRIGSIGRGRKECGPLKGRRMPGHVGSEPRLLKNLRVWRINTKYNVLWLQGASVMGDIGAYLNIYDSRTPEIMQDQLIANPPPFPTISPEEHAKLNEELYDSEIHKFDEPTIVFEESEEDRRQLAILSKKGKAKTAQKIR